jgi:hypothetical protein
VNLRVVREWDWSCESYVFRIEDVYEGQIQGVAPFVQHGEGVASALSLEDLRSRLRAMLKATEKPVLEMTKPCLREVSPELRKVK